MYNGTDTGKRIKAIRGNMKQEECANKLGISRAALSSYENGYRTMDIEILYKFSELFNVSTDYILGRTPNPTIIEISRCIECGASIYVGELAYRIGGGCRYICEDCCEQVEMQLPEWEDEFEYDE